MSSELLNYLSPGDQLEWINDDGHITYGRFITYASDSYVKAETDWALVCVPRTKIVRVNGKEIDDWSLSVHLE